MSNDENMKKAGKVLENYAKVRYQMRNPGNPNPSNTEMLMDSLSYFAKNVQKIAMLFKR